MLLPRALRSLNRLELSVGLLSLLAALLCWVAGLLGIVHWSYNFHYDPDFLFLSQIWKSLAVVLVLYLGSGLVFALFMERWGGRKGRFSTAALVALTVLLAATSLWALSGASDCGETVRRMKSSGVAYDAKESGLFGGIKIDEPSGDRFSPDTQQLVWWGRFDKPFEYWGSPDLTADWFDPEGQLVASIDVETEQCKLARAVIRQEQFKPGIWRVDVNCEDRTPMDSRSFGVGYPPVISQDVQVVSGSTRGEETRMIEAP